LRSRRAHASAAILAATLASFAASGCAWISRARGVESAAATSVDLDATPAQLADAVAKQRQSVERLRATGKLQVTVDARRGEEVLRNRFRASQAILVAEPASFRLEALSPFGVAYAVASDGREIAVLIPSEGLVYRGAADLDTVAAATGVVATPSDVTDLLLGRAPVPPLDLKHAWVSRPGEGTAAATSENADDAVPPLLLLHATAQDDLDDLVVVGFAPVPGGGTDLVPVLYERITGAGDLVLRARFGAFRPSPAGPFATRVEIQAIDSEAVLTYGDFEVNPSLAPGAFAIATPSGAREMRLDAVPAVAPDADDPA
jgi:hypothetical protein